MGSSEIVDSGRVVRPKSFSMTCNRLSRYLKEKGSLGNIGLVLTPPPHQQQLINMEPKGTMDLLPMIEKSGRNEIHGKSEVISTTTTTTTAAAVRKPHHDQLEPSPEKNPQMTMFYGGRVIVFDDLPANRAEEIMTLASKLSAGGASRAAQERDQPAANTILHQHAPTLLDDSDLPIARKNSLSRFLEKRKDRVTANAPYPTVVKPPSVKAAEEGSWLGLMSHQFQSH